MSYRRLLCGGRFVVLLWSIVVVSRVSPLPTRANAGILRFSDRAPAVLLSGGSLPLLVSLPTGPMTVGRARATATLLPNGQAIVVGGIDPFVSAQRTADLFDPTTSVFTATSPLNDADRQAHAAATLPSGDIVIAGGYTNLLTGGLRLLSSAERYHVGTSAFQPTGALNNARYGHTATTLADGRVLVVGGRTLNFTEAITVAELYDPSSGRFTLSGSLGLPRAEHTATLLPSGEVLIAGGVRFIRATPNTVIAVSIPQTELYNPTTGQFRPGPALLQDRYRHTATLLPDGTVVFIGGIDSIQDQFYLKTVERYDSIRNTITASGAVQTGRQDHTAEMLPSGQVLVSGGQQRQVCAFAERFQPDQGRSTLRRKHSLG